MPRQVFFVHIPQVDGITVPESYGLPNFEVRKTKIHADPVSFITVLKSHVSEYYALKFRVTFFMCRFVLVSRLLQTGMLG